MPRDERRDFEERDEIDYGLSEGIRLSRVMAEKAPHGKRRGWEILLMQLETVLALKDYYQLDLPKAPEK